MIDFILKYWLEVLFGGCLGALSLAYRHICKRLKEQKLVKEGIEAILHDRLWQAGRDFIPKGEVTLDELKNVEYIYNAYHNLGGNGTGTEIFERIKNLNIKERQ